MFIYNDEEEHFASEEGAKAIKSVKCPQVTLRAKFSLH